MFFFHGIPGCRLMCHPDDSIAISLGVRLVVPDRPGMGGSDNQPGRTLLDWTDDVLELAEALGIPSFAVLGFSGGGPYVAACAYKIPRRLSSAGILSGIAPLDAPGALQGMLRTNKMGYTVGKWMPWPLWWMIFRLYYGNVHQHPEALARMNREEPAADQHSYDLPGLREMYLSGFSEAFRQGTDGVAWEGRLVARPWGFRLEEISKKVHLWHGEEDVVVTPAMGRYLAEKIPGCEWKMMPGEGHLLYITYWREILSTITA